MRRRRRFTAVAAFVASVAVSFGVAAIPVASADTLDFVTVERPFFPLPPPPISLPASPAPGAAPATASQSPNP